jgi:hypothetical protein
MAGRKSKLTDDRQRKIVGLLEKGATDKDACTSVGIDESTFYLWLKDGKEQKSPEKIEFLEAVTRARAKVNVLATNTLRLGMLPTELETETTETITETRLKKDGTLYEYQKTTTRKSVATQPGDWRAAVEWLKRRDPEHWTDHVVVAFSPEALIAMQQLGVNHSEAVKEFERIVIQAAADAAAKAVANVDH